MKNWHLLSVGMSLQAFLHLFLLDGFMQCKEAFQWSNLVLGMFAGARWFIAVSEMFFPRRLAVSIFTLATCDSDNAATIFSFMVSHTCVGRSSAVQKDGLIRLPRPEWYVVVLKAVLPRQRLAAHLSGSNPKRGLGLGPACPYQPHNIS